MNFLKRLFGFTIDSSYEEAISLYGGGNYEDAIAIFQNILAAKSPDKSLHARLASFYLGQAFFNLGVVQFLLGNFVGSAERFESARRYAAGQTELYEYLGICYNNIGRFDEAMKCFAKVLKTDPGHLPSQLKLGITFHNLRMWDRTISLCQEILAVYPGYADVFYHQGLAHLVRGERQEAKAALEQAITINPQYREAKIKLAMVLIHQGAFAQAQALLDQLIAQHPEYPDLYYYQGLLHAGKGERPAAIAAFSKALELSPAFYDARVKLGVYLWQCGNIPEARRVLAEGEKHHPNDCKLNIVRQHLDQSAGGQSLPSALAEQGGQTGFDFHQHIEIMPKFGEMLAMMKRFPNEDVSMFEALIPVVRETVEQQPEFPDLRCNLGSLYFKTKRLDEAEEQFVKALELNADYLLARFNLFRTRKAQGKLESAHETGQRLLDLGCRYPDVYCALGEICLVLGKMPEADQYLRMALEQQPDYAEAHFHLAKVLLHGEQNAEATLSLKRCLQSHPGAPLLDEAQQLLHTIDSPGS